MTYAVADIHGCYREFLMLLEKIGFTDEDDLYILGDAVDYGEEPIKLLLDIMMRPNVFLITGNHEFMMNEVLSRLSVEITEESIAKLNAEDVDSYLLWLGDGGETTSKQFTKLPAETRLDIIEYIRESELYAEVEANGKRFILAHADLHNFDGDFDSLSMADFCMYRADYSRRYFPEPDTFLVTGHTPTQNIRSDGQPLIYEENGHIAIDCGCVFGGKLAAYCFETGEKFYVERQGRRGATAMSCS